MSHEDECLAYVVHLRIEHRKSHGVVQRIERNWLALGEETRPSGQAPSVIEELQVLRSNLAEHFAEEDGGGCLEEAVCRCPSLGPLADRIERDHPILLAELDGIIARSRTEKKPAQRSDVQQRFRVFATRLSAHEVAESSILEVAFGRNAGQ